MKVELIIEDPKPTSIHSAAQPGWYKVTSTSRDRRVDGAPDDYAAGDILLLANGIICNLTHDFAESLWDARQGGGHISVLPLGATAVTVRFQKD